MVALFALTVIAGCSSGPTEVYVSPEIDSISEYQSQILVDGLVTEDEYRQAVLAERDCVTEAGYETSEIIVDGRQMGFESSADYSNEADPEAADQEFLELTNNCSLEYTHTIGFVLVKNNKIPNWFERRQLWSQLGDCLDGLGVTNVLDKPESQRIEELKEATLSADPATVSEIEECAAQHGVLFLISGSE